MSFRFEQFTEFAAPTPTDSIATQINDKIQELGDDWVPVHILGFETSSSEFAQSRAMRYLILFITRDELTGDFGKLVAGFRSGTISSGSVGGFY